MAGITPSSVTSTSQQTATMVAGSNAVDKTTPLFDETNKEFSAALQLNDRIKQKDELERLKTKIAPFSKPSGKIRDLYYRIVRTLEEEVAPAIKQQEVLKVVERVNKQMVEVEHKSTKELEIKHNSERVKVGRKGIRKKPKAWNTSTLGIQSQLTELQTSVLSFQKHYSNYKAKERVTLFPKSNEELGKIAAQKETELEKINAIYNGISPKLKRKIICSTQMESKREKIVRPERLLEDDELSISRKILEELSNDELFVEAWRVLLEQHQKQIKQAKVEAAHYAKELDTEYLNKYGSWTSLQGASFDTSIPVNLLVQLLLLKCERDVTFAKLIHSAESEFMPVKADSEIDPFGEKAFSYNFLGRALNTVRDIHERQFDEFRIQLKDIQQKLMKPDLSTDVCVSLGTEMCSLVKQNQKYYHYINKDRVVEYITYLETKIQSIVNVLAIDFTRGNIENLNSEIQRLRKSINSTALSSSSSKEYLSKLHELSSLTKEYEPMLALLADIDRYTSKNLTQNHV